MQYAFGTGVLWGTPQTDAFGAAISNPTPVKLGALQSVNLDVQFNSKALYGSNQFPLAVARGTGKVTGKANFAQLNGQVLNSLFFGQTLNNGILTDYNDLTGTAIPGTPYQITPTIPGSGTWAADLGVIDANGVPMTRVASAPATGQYSVAAGVYTFAAADTTKTVFICFQYTATSTTAKKQTVNNLALGYSPSFSADLIVPYAGKVLTLHLYNCISHKLTFGTKLEDFVVPDFEWDCFSDGANRIMDWSTSE